MKEQNSGNGIRQKNGDYNSGRQNIIYGNNNHIYEANSGGAIYPLSEVAEIKGSIPTYVAWVIELVALLANVFTITSFIPKVKSEKIEAINSPNFYVVIVVLSLFIIITAALIGLYKTGWVLNFIKRGGEIYRIKNPRCGLCKARMKVEYINGAPAFVCKKNKQHGIYFDYTR